MTLIGKLTDCAKDSSTTRLQLDRLDITVSNSGWNGPAQSTQTMTVSAQIGNGSPAEILRALIETFGPHELELPPWLQPGANAASTIALRHLIAGFAKAPANQEISILSFGFGLEFKTAAWVLIDNLLTVSGLRADFLLNWPEEKKPPVIRVSVGGDLTFAEAPIAITATAMARPGPADSVATVTDTLQNWQLISEEDKAADPEFFKDLSAMELRPQTQFDFEIIGRLDSKKLKKPLTLGESMRHFGWSTNSPDDSGTSKKQDDPLSLIEIQELEVGASTATRSFDFLLRLAEHKPKADAAPGPGRLTLEELYLQVSGSADLGISGTLACTVSFEENLKADLRASCERAGGGWIFEGQLSVKDGKKLREAISKGFGVTLPDFVDNLKGRSAEGNAFDVDIQFNTSTREFNLSVRANFDLGGTTAGIDVEIAVAPEDNGSSFLVSGTLELGNAESNATRRFDLSYESLGRDKAPVLVATYTEQDTEPLDLGDLVGNLGGLDLHKVTFKIPGAVFAWQQDKDQQKDVKLLAFNVEGGLDLAAIKFPNIPIPHDSTDAGISAKLDFQVVLASRELKKDNTDDQALRAAIAARGFALIDGEIGSGANLAAQLRLGNETRTLAAQPPSEQLPDSQQIAAKAANQPSAPGQAPPGEAHWLDLHRKIGPLRFERIGLQFLTQGDPRVAMLLDAGFEFAGLQISLDGLKLESPLSKFAPSFSLSGLGISYRNPAIEIGGALLLVENGFAGNVIIKGKKFSLSAIGIFQSVGDNQPSLFIYATLDAALGGPPFFYVTGLAAGIGYNRDVLLPEAEAVKDFPLVQRVLKGDSDPETPMLALEKLVPVMPIAIGRGFVAIGVHFTSFKVLDSFALLVAKFGPHFELDVIGISILISPPGAGDNPVISATLGLRAQFIPDEGILAVRAVLSSDSYVLSKSSHLGGGFAFSAWFCNLPEKAITAGDFVITLGGYHPAFVPPRHYPTVPRLSLEWSVNEHLSLKGSAYFALTGSHVMAGGRFEAAWLSENVRAMFVAQADFLMTWKPYHYDVKMHVSIAAEVTIQFFGTHHLSLDAGADVHLWGPEFSGAVRLYIVVFGLDLSFDAEFGHGALLAKAIDWDLFRKSFLPESKPKVMNGKISAIGVREGLLGHELGEKQIPIVTRGRLALAFETPVPLSKLPWKDGKAASVPSRPAIAPMGLKAEDFESEIKFEFFFGDQSESTKLLDAELMVDEEMNHDKDAVKIKFKRGDSQEFLFLVSPIRKAMPAGVWGPSNTTPALDGGLYLEHQRLDAPRLVEEMVVGFEILLLEQEKKREFVDDKSTVTDEVSVLFPAERKPRPNTSGQLSSVRRDELLRAYGLTPAVIAA